MNYWQSQLSDAWPQRGRGPSYRAWVRQCVKQLKQFRDKHTFKIGYCQYDR